MPTRFIAISCLFLLAFPASVYSEHWDFKCTEAVTLLKRAQERVVQKHDQLQAAKFSLRYLPKEFNACSKNRRGFHGGEIHCVRHESPQGNVLRDVLVAQRSLEVATQEFENQIQGVLQNCPVSKP